MKAFREGYLPDYNICYLEGIRQKDDMLYQTFFGTEACESIRLYLKDRLNKLTKKNPKIVKILDSEPLFVSKNKKMNQRYFSEKMKEVVDNLDLYNITPKSLRRWFNTHLEKNSIKTSVIGRLMGHKGDVKDEYYNEMFEHAKEGEYEELATDYVENIDALVSLGNGNRKYNAVEKEIDDLKIINKGLELTVEELKQDKIENNKKLDDLTNTLKDTQNQITKIFSQIGEEMGKDFQYNGKKAR